MNKEKLSYLKAIAIVHGKSEKQMCDFIKSNLRLRIDIVSDKKGEKSIEITSIMNILRNTIFKSFKDFIKKYDEVEIIQKKYLSKDFKIFIILDIDKCDEKKKSAFIDKSMFKDHWAYEYIVPIYNDDNLEEVLNECGIIYEKKLKPNDKAKCYIKIFPTDKKYTQKNDILQLSDFLKRISKSKKSNMKDFLLFCIKCSEQP